MRFVYSKPKSGDTIRARAGSIYHYGIYVSDDEIIQFGPSPKDKDYLKKEKRVLVSNANVFSCGERIQVGRPNRKETKERFSDETIIGNARKRIGETGYNLIHNNCEHFVYECSFGYKKCTQEDWARNHFNKRTILNVYLKEIGDEEIEDVYPPSRNREIREAKREETRQEKYAVWKLLEFALKHSFSKDIKDLTFKKDENGKWSCGKIKLSLSHSNRYVMVGVSNHKVGVDIEGDRNYTNERMEKIKRKVFTEEEMSEDFYEVWTKKESIFKCEGKGKFSPKEIDTNRYACRSGKINGYTYSVCGKVEHLHLYEVKDGEAIRL